jgi:hypothetical protein
MVTNTFTNGTTADADEVNQNFTDVESLIVGHAQNAYQTLQANDVFDNKDFLAADEFVDSTGTNNTVNTTLTTADYITATTSYSISFVDLVSGDTTHNPDTLTNPENFFDGDATTLTQYSETTNAPVTKQLGKTFPARTIQNVNYDVRGSVANNNTRVNIYLQTFDGSAWSTHTTIKSNGDNTRETGTIVLNSVTQGIRIQIFLNNSATETHTAYFYELSYDDGVYQNSSIAVVDTNTLTLTGSENSICVYSDKTIPTNTSITVDISDGTTTLSSQAINSMIGIDSLSSGTLKLTFNLITTDTSVTPVLYGYGVFMK